MRVVIHFVIVVGVAWVIGSPAAVAQESGKDIYQQRCSACHKIGGGRLVGPDLAGVSERRTEDWLVKWIKSSQALVKSGDPVAKSLVDEFKMVMPDQPLSDEQIKGVLAYIKESGGQAPAAPKAPEPARESSQEDVERGQNLFQGKLRFGNGGPACISCHSVNSEAFISGGALAKGLTTAYSRIGEQGVRAILASPPFPVMNAAFEGRALSEEEIRGLIAFLRFADRENTLHQPREYGWAMFGTGSAGVGALLGFYSIVGRRRKRGSVNQEIYDRQIKSE